MNKGKLFLSFISTNQFGGTLRDSKFTVATITVNTDEDQCHLGY